MHTLTYPQKQDAGRAQSRPPGAITGGLVLNGPWSQARDSRGPCSASSTTLQLEGDPGPSRAEAEKSPRLPRSQDLFLTFKKWRLQREGRQSRRQRVEMKSDWLFDKPPSNYWLRVAASNLASQSPCLAGVTQSHCNPLQVGPPGQGPGSEASTFCEKHIHTILENFSNHQFAFCFHLL